MLPDIPGNDLTRPDEETEETEEEKPEEETPEEEKTEEEQLEEEKPEDDLGLDQTEEEGNLPEVDLEEPSSTAAAPAEETTEAELVEEPAPTSADAPLPTQPGSDEEEVAPPPQEELVEEPVNVTHSAQPHENNRLVIIVPANYPHPNLCKFLVSAIALGYPSPVIVNWGMDYHEVSHWEGGQNLPKIPGVVRYLEAAMHESAHPDDKLKENDIVLVADAFDTWFQLPPEVMLKRYHEINLQGNARLKEQWTKKTPMPMKNTIVVAAQKKCYPGLEAHNDLHCDHLPESPLRKDLYGPETDKITKESGFHNVRPKFINGGSYIGPAGDMRRFFRRILFKLEESVGKGLHMYSEQGLSGEVLGEQELWRKMARETDLPDDETTNALKKSFEYHIGLDYHQVISIATVFEEIDGQFITLNNKSGIASISEKLGISPVRLRGLPDDIKVAPNPLDDLMDNANADWGEMPLYSDFFTEAIPATVHHNAHKDGLKSRRTRWWDKTWYFGYLRELLALRLKPSELTPIGTVINSQVNITYWAPESDRRHRRPRFFEKSVKKPLKEVPDFNAVCKEQDEKPDSQKHWWDEVFRDGQGPIVNVKVEETPSENANADQNAN